MVLKRVRIVDAVHLKVDFQACYSDCNQNKVQLEDQEDHVQVDVVQCIAFPNEGLRDSLHKLNLLDHVLVGVHDSLGLANEGP